MYKMITAAFLAVFIWILPAPSKAAFPSEDGLHRAYPEDINTTAWISPASARFSVHTRPYGTFAFGSFGGRRFNKFGKKGFYPYRGFYPHKPYRFGKYGGYRYGYYPFLGRNGSFNRDPFFYDRYNRFAPGSGFGFPYYSPFGTRRPGW